MEEVEIKYRETSRENTKYLQRLTEYIDFLITKGKIIEAKHYFQILNENSPNHIRTIKIGYSLSIATFDNAGVKIFDELFYNLKKHVNELVLFRLKYYISVNNLKEIEYCCDFLLSQTVQDDCLEIILEACVNFKSFLVAKSLILYLDKKRIKLNNKTLNRIKQIMIQRLVDVLIENKHV